MHRESLIVSFEADAALRTLPMLLAGNYERRRAMELCLEVAGPLEKMSEAVTALFERFGEVLEVESGIAGPDANLPRAVARATAAAPCRGD